MVTQGICMILGWMNNGNSIAYFNAEYDICEPTNLRQGAGDDMPVHIGEAPFDAVVVNRQALMVDSQQVQ